MADMVNEILPAGKVRKTLPAAKAETGAEVVRACSRDSEKRGAFALLPEMCRSG
jgi:hypothetical protein